MKLFAATLLLAAAGLFSCNSEDKTASETLPVDSSVLAPTVIDTATKTATADSIATQPTVNVNQTAAPVVLPAPATTTTKSTAGLNPAHGQPGHRCDIAVGAPLNSAPAKAPTAGVLPANPTMSQPAIVAPTNGTARLNPPHGQPGHDCSVEVGKPLKQ